MTEGMIQGHRRISGATETPDGFPSSSNREAADQDAGSGEERGGHA